MLCCGMFFLFFRLGDLFIEYMEIVICDNWVLCCFGCKGEVGYIGMWIELLEFVIGGWFVIVMKVDFCVYEFWVCIGIDLKIRLEEWMGE